MPPISGIKGLSGLFMSFPTISLKINLGINQGTITNVTIKDTEKEVKFIQKSMLEII